VSVALILAAGLNACGGGDDDILTEPTATDVATDVATTRATANTVAPATAGALTTESPRRTTTPPRTTVPRSTTTLDALTAAFVSAGYGIPTDEARDAMEEFCPHFSGKDAEWINRAFSNPDTSARLAVAFPVLCPDNVALLGIAVMPNGDPVFPDYPALVDVSTIDERVANWFKGKLIEGQVVALAPGVYTPYNPNVPDLVSYLTGPNDGDCAMRSEYFPGTGGRLLDRSEIGTYLCRRRGLRCAPGS